MPTTMHIPVLLCRTFYLIFDIPGEGNMKKFYFRKLAIYIGLVLLLLPLAGLVTATPEPQGHRSGAPTVVSYQGQVKVGGAPYSGTGYFKFAIVDLAGTTSYWSNDGTSSGGGEPVVGVALSVNTGLFHVLLGDTSLAGMTQALFAGVFSGTDRSLRGRRHRTYNHRDRRGGHHNIPHCLYTHSNRRCCPSGQRAGRP